MPPILLSLTLLLCCTPSFAAPPPAAATAPTTSLATATVTLGGQDFEAEVAHTPAQRAKGLMFRQSMPDNHGMLFLFPHSRRLAFWMKNTEIPLDILFFDQQARLIRAHINVPPCRQPPCAHYSSNTAAAMVLELNGGRSLSLGLEAGSRLSIENQAELPSPE